MVDIYDYYPDNDKQAKNMKLMNKAFNVFFANHEWLSPKHNKKLYNLLSLDNMGFVFVPKNMQDKLSKFVESYRTLRKLADNNIIYSINFDNDFYLIGISDNSMFSSNRPCIEFSKIFPKFTKIEDYPFDDDGTVQLSWQMKDYYNYDTESWHPCKLSDATRYWYLDTNSIRVRQSNLKKGKMINLPVSQSIDFMHNNLLLGKASKIPEFFVGNDFYKQYQKLYTLFAKIGDKQFPRPDKKRGIKHLKEELYSTLNYHYCSQFGQDNTALLKKYKSLQSLKRKYHLDFNKLSYIDIMLLNKLQHKLSKHEFNKFYNCFIKNKKKMYSNCAMFYFSEWQNEADDYDINNNYDYYQPLTLYFCLYATYLLFKLGIKDNNSINEFIFDDNPGITSIIRDYISNFSLAYPHKKIEVPYTKIRSLKDDKNKLKHRCEIIVATKKYKQINKDVITSRPKWDRLLQNIKQDKNITALLKPQDLISEGENQQNCMGTYVGKYINDECGIMLHYDSKKHNEQDSLEVVIDKNGHYKINQIYSKYDHRANPANTRYLNRIINQ